MEIKFVQESIGWHRNCVMHATYGKDKFIMPVRITMLNDHNYKIAVGNFMYNLSNIEFEISYREDKLIVIFDNAKKELYGESYFKLTNQQLRAYTTIYVDGKVVYHEDEPIEQLTYTKEHLQQAYKQKVFLADMDSAFTYAAIYRLPWNDFMIYRNHHTQDEQYDRTDYDIIYVNEYQGKLVLRQYSYGLVEDKSNGLKLRTDGAVMRKIYYGDKRKEIETFFMPVGYYSGWDYKEYLEDKYFYHTTEEMQE